MTMTATKTSSSNESGRRGARTSRGRVGTWTGRGLAVAAGVAFFAVALCGCTPRSAEPPPDEEPPGSSAASPTAPKTGTVPQEQKLPRLLDLGAHSCIPCKMMAPILEELKKDYAEVFKTEFIDVWQDSTAGQKHGIRAIPTQIFFDAEGKERFRHEGFLSKEDILAKWKELGVALP